MRKIRECGKMLLIDCMRHGRAAAVAAAQVEKNAKKLFQFQNHSKAYIGGVEKGMRTTVTRT